MADINEELTFEYIGRNDFVLYQQKGGFRFGTDSVMLAWFASSFVRHGKDGMRKADMLELGAGSGGATMCVAARLLNANIDAVELMESSYKVLCKNIEANNIENRVRAFNSDIRKLPKEVKEKQYDVVFLNPPFFCERNGTKVDVDARSVEVLNARFEENGNLDDFIRVAASRVKISGGHVVSVMHGDRLSDLMAAYIANKITPTRLITVHPFEDRNACIVLLAGKRGNKNSELKVLPPLILNERLENGSIVTTKRVVDIYQEEHTDCFI